jgi:hypothetical protein
MFGCVALAGLGAIGLTTWLGYEFSPPSDRTLTGLKDEGNEIVGKLEAYKARHREYPPDLRSAHITPPTHYQGDWTYWVADDRSRYGPWIHHNGRLEYDDRTGWSFTRSNSSD